MILRDRQHTIQGIVAVSETVSKPMVKFAARWKVLNKNFVMGLILLIRTYGKVFLLPLEKCFFRWHTQVWGGHWGLQCCTVFCAAFWWINCSHTCTGVVVMTSNSMVCSVCVLKLTFLQCCDFCFIFCGVVVFRTNVPSPGVNTYSVEGWYNTRPAYTSCRETIMHGGFCCDVISGSESCYHNPLNCLKNKSVICYETKKMFVNWWLSHKVVLWSVT